MEKISIHDTESQEKEIQEKEENLHMYIIYLLNAGLL